MLHQIHPNMICDFEETSESADFSLKQIFQDEDYHRKELINWIAYLNRDIQEVRLAISKIKYHLTKI